jgi:hypothetical protein
MLIFQIIELNGGNQRRRETARERLSEESLIERGALTREKGLYFINLNRFRGADGDTGFAAYTILRIDRNDLFFMYAEYVGRADVHTFFAQLAFVLIYHGQEHWRPPCVYIG